MMARFMRGVGRVVIAHPGVVAGFSLCMSLFFYANIHNLRTGTDLTDMFGKHDPQWQAVSQIGKELGYGNQLYILIEAPKGDADTSAAMEDMADRLSAEMMASGLFKQARSGVQEDELVNAARFYSWNFPSFATADQVSMLRERLDPQQIHRNVRQTAAAMVTPFSSMGTDYFVADPLGLMNVEAGNGKDLSQFGNFDLSWGSGDRFFSKDHKALLMIAEPRESAVDYKFAGQVVQWTQAHIASIRAEQGFQDSGIDAIQAGPYVYAGQDHAFILRNIRRVSLISIAGNLVLCLLVYPNLPMLFLSLIPANLGILWTTGIASFYPGEVNLISLAFIAILAGLGDDQVVHFFNRTPQEWSKGGSLNAALLLTYETTGLSVVLCILTAATATVALAASEFKALAEFGFILTVGMFAMMFHTLLTVPALMQLWERFFKPRAPKAITFRFLPTIAHKIVDLTGRHARLIVAGASALFLLSILTLPSIKLDQRLEIEAGGDNAAAAAQKSLSDKFGIAGSPDLLLIAGSQEDVLRRAEELSAHLESYKQQGAIQSIFSPSSLLPSIYTQKQRAALLTKIDLAASAQALETSLQEDGLQVAPHRPYIERLRELARGSTAPVTLESASGALPAGLLDSSMRKTQDGSYVAAIAYYPTDPDNAQVVPDGVLESWRNQYGPFVNFSFEKINRDMQSRLLRDSRRALIWTAVGISLIVYLSFRNLRVSLLVLMPIVFAIIVAFGILKLAGHHFSFMSITAIPLIIGIGIDNGIHLVRRYLENAGSSILTVAKSSGAPLIQSNLTTIIGFGALMASTFAPLAELGLVASLGVALALVGGLCLIPAVIVLDEKKRRALKDV
ncbi:MAG TPA: MMPL family transporter [Acidobacteriaceae bacterium]|nr:MMPL family transporter [Acidobacteriaceae bacterium]